MSVETTDGSAIYEYGQALTVLGLAAELFADIDPMLHFRSLSAGERVARYCIRTFVPTTSEGNAMLLAGLCRLDGAQRRARDATASIPGGMTGAPRLTIYPNPIRDSGTILCGIAPGVTTRIRILDSTGRTRTHLDPVSIGPGGSILWDGSDDARRPLPSGRYHALVETAGTRRIAAFTVLR